MNFKEFSVTVALKLYYVGSRLEYVIYHVACITIDSDIKYYVC